MAGGAGDLRCAEQRAFTGLLHSFGQRYVSARAIGKSERGWAHPVGDEHPTSRFWAGSGCTGRVAEFDQLADRTGCPNLFGCFGWLVNSEVLMNILLIPPIAFLISLLLVLLLSLFGKNIAGPTKYSALKASVYSSGEEAP